MQAAGLFRLAGWLHRKFNTAAKRRGELARRFPAAPARVINAAEKWTAQVVAAAKDCAKGDKYTCPKGLTCLSSTT